MKRDMNDAADHTSGESGSSDRLILRRAAILFGVSAVVAVVSEVLEAQFVRSSEVLLKYAGALLAGLSAGAVVVAFMALAVTGAAAASIGARALMERGVSRRAIRGTVAVAIAALIGVLFVFLPFCLGSLADGTYECVPLATRLLDKLTG
jgi:hypothetical protein